MDSEAFAAWLRKGWLTSFGRGALVAFITSTGAGLAGASDTADQTKSPVKLAVFPFELDDQAAAPKEGEAQYLRQATEEAKQQLAHSGRYTVMAAEPDSPAQVRSLRDCDGCATAIARKLGADQALVGVVTRISNTEYLIKFEVSDTQTGQVIGDYATDLRMGADYSWSRGVRWLILNRMLATN